MDAPRTLLDFAGIAAQPASLEEAALVIIDAQREYVDGLLPLSGVEEAIGEIAELLRAARARKAPVFHIVHHGRAGAALFDPDRPFSSIVSPLAPVEGEKTVIKGLPNSFAATRLYELVGETGRANLILAGFATHMCVSSTARAALDLGLRCTIVASATATRDLPDPAGGGTIAAADVKRAALAALADRFAAIAGSAADLN